MRWKLIYKIGNQNQSSIDKAKCHAHWQRRTVYRVQFHFHKAEQESTYLELKDNKFKTDTSVSVKLRYMYTHTIYYI